MSAATAAAENADFENLFDRVTKANDANAMPSARERLAYVARMTEQATLRTLGAIAAAQPLQDQMAADAVDLAARWDSLIRCEMDIESFKILVGDNREFLDAVQAHTCAGSTQLREILMAQESQGLTVQVIKTVSGIVGELEQQLLALLTENAAPENRRQAIDLPHRPVTNLGRHVDLLTRQEHPRHL